jgi:hypothetical protein
MKLLTRLAIIVMMFSCVAGCAVFGTNREYQPFDTGKLDNVTVGKTTAREVAQAFGAPSQVVKLVNGNAYIYERAVAKGTGLWLVLVSFGNYETQYDRLVFFFDMDNILIHYGISLNAGDASYGFPF